MLDRLAGDAVDIIVNGKPIAKGEVVVIEENYGVRITEMFAASDGTDQ
jgi:flagellar motor switch protein FliN/FliY